MEPIAVILSGAGALLLLFMSIGIGALLRSSQRQGDRLGDVATSIASIGATLAGVAQRVDALDRWKDAVQERENADLRAEVADLKLGRARRAGDT